MGSGIIRYMRASKTFSKFRACRSSVRFEVPCASKFRAFRSSVRLEVPCGYQLFQRAGLKHEIVAPYTIKLHGDETEINRVQGYKTCSNRNVRPILLCRALVYFKHTCYYFKHTCYYFKQTCF